MIYLDHAASTPADPRVVEAMLPWFAELHANASSPHLVGKRAARAVASAREHVALLIGCEPSRVVFTSGATEALNTAVSIATALADPHRRSVAVAANEHKAVLAASGAHAGGRAVRVIRPRPDGRVAIDDVREVADHVAWGAFMALNNETGTRNDYCTIADTLHEHGCLTIVDLTQALGKIPVSLGDAVDLAALSGHKFGGPQGVGALIAPSRRPDEWRPMLAGGSQERGLRAGTLNLPGIVGIGEAARLATAEIDARVDAVRATAEAFWDALTATGDVFPQLNADPDVPHILNIWLPGVDNTMLLARCRDIAFATGSACNSDLPQPSHVLTSMGLSTDRAQESIRVSFSHTTSVDDATTAAKALAEAAAEIAEVDAQ